MLTRSVTDSLLQYALDRGADFAELFFEDKDDTTINYDGQVDSVACIRTYGVGLYLIRDTRSAYVYLNDLTDSGLRGAVDRAAALLGLERCGTTRLGASHTLDLTDPCPVAVYPGEVGHAEKIALLTDADRAGRAQSASVHGLKLTWFDRDQRVTIANTEGLWTEDRRVNCRMRFIPVISNTHGTASTFSEYCAAAGIESFRDGLYLNRLRDQINNLEESITAVEAPSARVPVVLEAGGCTGTFFHEACGHQLETTALQRDSIFWDKRG